MHPRLFSYREQINMAEGKSIWSKIGNFIQSKVPEQLKLANPTPTTIYVLNKDILGYIFAKFDDPADLFSVNKVNREWRSVSNHVDFWKKFYERDYNRGWER
jgi:hypothetical protein